MANNITISADYFPTIPRSEIIDKSQKHFSFKELEGLGGAFTLTASALSKISVKHTGAEFFKCEFPDGVVGSLAKFRDGSGFTGTIMNENGIAAQARWIPADATSVMCSFDPVTLAMGMAVMNINHKLEKLQNSVDEILDFLKLDKESSLEGSVNLLADIFNQYKFNSDNAIWKNGKFPIATKLKGDAENNIIFYRNQISRHIKKSQEWIYSFSSSKELKMKLDSDFHYYRLCMYLYAQATYLEVLLGENYSEDYLTYVTNNLKKYGDQYWDDYAKSFDELEKHLNNNAERNIAEGIGYAAKFLGKTISNIPWVSEGNVDEALISAGHSIEHFATCDSKKVMKDFSNNSDSCIRLFLDSLEEINTVCNKPLEIYFDDQEVFFVEGKTD